MTIYFAMSEKLKKTKQNKKKTYYFIKISTTNFRAGNYTGGTNYASNILIKNVSFSENVQV